MGTTLSPHAFHVYFGSETHLGLNNDGDAVRLLYPDHTVADKIVYTPVHTNVSYARRPDGSENWVTACVPTPDAPNCSQQPSPTPTRAVTLTSIGDARQLPDGALVSVLGSVVAHPCELDARGRELTLSDGAAGINVYFAYPNQFSCQLARNSQIIVTGILRDHYGMKTLYPRDAQDIDYDAGAPLEIAPRQIHTGALGEATESMLVTLQGAVSNGKGGGDFLWLNDGTGIVELRINGVTGASFAGITYGSRVRVTGISYRYAKNPSAPGGYFLKPRQPDDIVVLDLADKIPSAPGGRGKDLGAVSIAQALSMPTQNYVTIGGTITVPPGLFGDRDFWIEDAQGYGMRVFVSAPAGIMPPLKPNENVTVRGRVVNFSGAREIRVELAGAINIYGVGVPLSPSFQKSGQLDFSHGGALVQIQGLVTRADGRQIYIDDGSGGVLVYIDASTHIRWSRFFTGEQARITGILTRFRGAPEILPRNQTDVQFGNLLLPITGGNVPAVPPRATAALARPLTPSSQANASAIASQSLTSQAITSPALPSRRKPIAPLSLPAPTLAPASLSIVQPDPISIAALLLLTLAVLSASLAFRKFRTPPHADHSRHSN